MLLPEKKHPETKQQRDNVNSTSPCLADASGYDGSGYSIGYLIEELKYQLASSFGFASVKNRAEDSPAELKTMHMTII